MKQFSINKAQGVLAIAVIGALFLVTYATNFSFLKAPKVGAAGGDNVSGWAWANTPQSSGAPATGIDQGLGWISFNNTTDGSATVYGVNIDSVTGNFSGYAYMGNGGGSGDTGWIHFAPVGPYPGVPNYSARRVGNTVEGWARAISTTDGFDGWIKLSDTAAPAYSVTINPTTGNFSGYAWGSDVLGWIDFGPIVGGVFMGVKIAVPLVCNDSLATISSNVCNPPADCPSGAPFSNGTMLWSCAAPLGGSVLKTCSGTCLIIPPASTCGDNICTQTETLLTCPQDCKGTVQQF